jgi:purine nucleosidase
MVKKRMILDCDPGQDDAIAIFLSYIAPELSLEAITTVGGTIPVELTTRNALGLIAAAAGASGGQLTPVYGGAARPLKREPQQLDDRHNVGGLGNATLPAFSHRAEATPAPDFLVDVFMDKARRPDLLVCTGPLTNVALALQQQPELARQIPEIVLMGGAVREFGNRNPVAENNIYVDPEAADIVFKSGIPLTMAPLDVTHKILTQPEFMARLAALNNPVARLAHDILSFTGPWDIDRFGLRPVHDPVTIGWLLHPDLFRGGKRAHVAVETQSEQARGQTLVDWWGITGQPANTEVLMDVDVDGFFDWMLEGLGRY